MGKINVPKWLKSITCFTTRWSRLEISNCSFQVSCHKMLQVPVYMWATLSLYDKPRPNNEWLRTQRYSIQNCEKWGKWPKNQNRISLKTVLKNSHDGSGKSAWTYINVKAIYYIHCSQYIFVCQYIKPSYFYLLPQISTAGR